MFQLAFAIPCLYVIARCLLPLKWPRWSKVVISLLLLLVAEQYLLTRLAFGTMFSMELPRAAVIGVNVLFGATLLLALFQLVLDLTTLLMMALKRRRLAVANSARYVLGIVALGLSAYGVSQAARVPPLKEIEVAVDNLPAEFEGYQILQLTDLHISKLFQRPWTEAVVAASNALSPDLIVITGDLIDGDLEDRRADVAPLGQLRAADGVYTIPGNHEYYFEYASWMQHYQTLGMRTLANGHAVISRGEGNLVLAGVTDLSAGRSGQPVPDLDAALAGAPPELPVILLDHQPSRARQAAEAGIDVQLSGHTHGGMVPGLDRLVARANNGFVSGFYEIGDMTLYVNNGTALWPGFALRLGHPSELTRITLRQG